MKEPNTQNLFDHAFHLLADFAVNRYLMANAEGRLDGYEKAIYHTKLCETFIALRFLVKPEDAMSFGSTINDPFNHTLYNKIHEHTQKLTSYMDTEIGFPIVGRPDYDTLAPKFEKRFLELAQEATVSYLKVHTG